ncbi:MAG: T9SS type A sorting domain-containing protein [Paludibacter sp.]|nr:T9SS type A sorting domain-containing protein [Paludibacter sp.]
MKKRAITLFSTTLWNNQFFSYWLLFVFICFPTNNSFGQNQISQSISIDRLNGMSNTTFRILRLTVSNGVNSDETIIYFRPDASNGYDGFDAEKMSNGNVNIPEIFTKINNIEIVINGMNSFESGTAIPLGFRTGTANNFTLVANEISNFDARTQIILRDNILQQETVLIRNVPDSFYSGIVNNMSRFTIIFKINSFPSDFFRSNGSGSWNAVSTWQSSGNGSTDWINASLVPANTASSVTISTGNEIIVNDNTSVSALNVNSLGKLNIAASKHFTVNNLFTNNGTVELLSDQGGTATILTPATLMGTGIYNVHQHISSERNWYLSSPVTNKSVPILLREDSVSSWNESFRKWEKVTGSLVAGKGYVSVDTRASNSIPTTAVFTGVLNNGNVPISLSRTSATFYQSGFNLIGNPYPSHIQWKNAIADTLDIENTIWYRTYNNGWKYPTFVPIDAGDFAPGIGTFDATGIIAPMQAFWVRKQNVGSRVFSFNNSMRLHSATPNLLKAPSANNSQRKIIRLHITNGIVNDEAVIYFSDLSTDGYDKYDGVKFSSDNVNIPEIYTVADGRKLAINGLNDQNEIKTLPLGFTTLDTSVKSYTIALAELSNFDPETRIILLDGANSIELTEGSHYVFESGYADNIDRFTFIVKASGGTTGFSNNNQGNFTVYCNQNKQITVICKSAVSSDATVSVYSIAGQRIAFKAIENINTFFDNPLQAGVYLVKIYNAGKITTEKIIIK